MVPLAYADGVVGADSDRSMSSRDGFMESSLEGADDAMMATLGSLGLFDSVVVLRASATTYVPLRTSSSSLVGLDLVECRGRKGKWRFRERR